MCEHLLAGPAGKPLGVGLALLLAVACVASWCSSTPGRGGALRFAGVIAATLLVSPHTQWYEAGLLFLAGC